MKTTFVRRRLRGASLSTVTPSPSSPEYSLELASIAARIIYQSPLPSSNDLPIFILDSAAFPDTKETSYDRLLPYVLSRLPDEDELIGGKGYEVVFFAGGSEERGDNDRKKDRPSITWTLQAYNLLGRAMRKRLTHLYLVHERRWVRVVTELFNTIVSPKFRRKVIHVSTLSQLALHLPIQDLLIPPSAYYRDRKLEVQIFAPFATGRRAFRVSKPFPTASNGEFRLPRVLRETTSFILARENIKTEGLFRINARAITLEVLKEAYDRGQKFVIWKEGEFMMDFHQWKEGFGNVCATQLDGIDGYPVLAAAGLVKIWYSDLLNPIFPESSYQYIERNYSGNDLNLTHKLLMDLIGPGSEWSQISAINRQILRMHLLPMLSAISQHPENKMTPKAMSVCFAPSLLRGVDPIRDAKLSIIVSNIIQYAIEQWKSGLCEKFSFSDDNFFRALETPSSAEDREDPLDRNTIKPKSNTIDLDNQFRGVTVVDPRSNTSSDDDDEEEDIQLGSVNPRPELPPRVIADPISFGSLNDLPPRYSTIIGFPPEGVQITPIKGEHRQPITNTVHRKPTPAQSRAATSGILPALKETALEHPDLDSVSSNPSNADISGPFSEATPNPQTMSATSLPQSTRIPPDIRADLTTVSHPGLGRKSVPEHSTGSSNERYRDR